MTKDKATHVGGKWVERMQSQDSVLVPMNEIQASLKEKNKHKKTNKKTKNKKVGTRS